MADLFFVIDLLIWLFLAVSVVYVFVFAGASLLPKKKVRSSNCELSSTFLVLYPAYKEDVVIRKSVETFLKQDYPREKYQLVVISDHMTTETNGWLSQQPVTLLQPVFEKSSKAKALQYAMSGVPSTYNYVVILDADNVVAPDFLSRLNRACALAAETVKSDSTQSHAPIAIQCHRTAKNADNNIAVLDGLSEEINNSIFRRGHNRLGLSSALIGSGMCFSFHWFKETVGSLSTAGEDKELEALLLKQRVFIRYEEDIYVMDEKVSGSDNFQRQRLRWMTAQVQCLFAMLPYVPKAVITGNINYLDKTFQQALVPRSILLVLTAAMTFLSTVFNFQFSIFNIKWWALLAMLSLALVMAIPRQMRTRAVFSKIVIVPKLAWRMIENILHVHPGNKDFIHTTHHHA
jgi:cellulose synthase/poly-beta-1,6-N-acetylglucosamine synthase-like glycosyltransferase